MQETEKNKSKKESKRRLVLLDAHAILHRAYHALPEFSTAKGEPTGALYGLSTMILKIISDLKPDFVIAAYDLPSPTYRHEAYEAYKAGRKKAEDDLVSQMTRSHDIFEAFCIPEYSLAGFEADDMLGTIVEQMKEKDDIDITIASGDMDTLQLVDNDRVRVYTLKKGIQDTILYNEKAVYERFGFSPALLPDFKGLRGDPSDNIVGVAGIGEKTATTLIKEFGTIENIYKILKKDPEKLREKGISERLVGILKENEEEAIFSKMLATIRRDAPIKFNLPPKSWREGFRMEKAEQVFKELEFMTLGARLRAVLDGEEKKKSPETGGLEFSNDESAIPADLLEETKIALWIIDSNITKPALEDIINFSGTRDFTKAREKILAEIKKRGLSFVFDEIEKPLIPVVRSMEDTGVKIDKEKLRALGKVYRSELMRLEKEIWKEAGAEFNVSSPKQVGEVLFEKMGLGIKNQKKTSTGMKSTRESELEKLKDSHPIVGKILSYRELAKLLSTYIDAIPALLDKKDRLHTKLSQTGTTTGRMSSTNPNLQNIPIRTELGRNIRNAFIAEKGYTFVSIDYSQIELRVAAILSGDEKLIEIFRKEEDVHSAVATYVFGVPADKVDKGMRTKAKTINFGILYGMGVNALRQNLGGTREEAQKYLGDYFREFSGLAKYIEEVKESAAESGYTETLFGRRRYFEGLNSKIPYIKAAAERMAVNAPLQGTAADIMKLAMKEIYNWLVREELEKEVRMTHQVHDELLFEIKKGKEKEFSVKIKEIMERVLPEEKSRGIVLRANASAGPSWGETEELAI